MVDVNDYVWRLKYDPNQPREPAGSPTGGRWARAIGNIEFSPELTPGEKATIVKNLQGVPPRHLEGLRLITKEPHWTQKVDDDGLFRSTFNPNNYASGCYDTRTKTIHMSPKHVDSAFVLIHELGHHVSLNASYEGQEEGWVDFAQEISDSLKGSSGLRLARMGLREYSTKNGRELLADAYKVWLKGSDSQWDELNRKFSFPGWPEINLQAIFGKRGT